MARFGSKKSDGAPKRKTPAKARTTRALIEAIEPRVMLSVAAADALLQSGSATFAEVSASAAPAATKAAAVVTVPGAPTAVTATASTYSQITLTWGTSGSAATGFNIERSQGGSAFTQIGTTAAKRFGDTGLAVNTTYVYRVIAYNTAGSSPASATATATTLNKIPGVPVSLTAAPLSSSQITLNWSPADTYAAGYTILRGSATIATVTGTSFIDSGLAANTSYTYQVLAFNSAGSSKASAKATAITNAAAAPAAPKSLTASAVSSSAITLKWATVDTVYTGFSIERSIGGGTFTKIGTTSTKTYSDTGLAAATTYTYRVSAFNTGGSSAASPTASATTTSQGIAIPAAPIGLSATATSISQISLAWTTNDSLATGFLIERSTAGGAFTQIANITAKTYNDTGLSEGVAYTYRVTAYNSAGSSAASATATANTFARPGTPLGLNATATSISQIALNWIPKDSLATGFIVERSTAGGAFVQIANITARSFGDSGLAEGVSYTYRVTAYDSAGSSAASATATASTLQRPAAPTNFSATATSISQINLKWTASDSLTLGYLLSRSTGGGAFTQIANVTTTSYSDVGLAEGTSYTYRIVAYDAGGSSVDSATALASTLQRPGTPTNLAAAPTSISQIQLTWTPADSLATGFIVERSQNGGAFAQVANVTTAIFTDSGLAEGAAYTYRVTAYDAGGSSGASASATAATLQRPGPPTSVSATAASISQINIAWTPADALATGFLVERSTGGGAFSQIADVSTSNYSDTGLLEGTTYTYRVTAYDAGGSSPASAIVTAATLQRPGQPANLSATAASISQINLAWTPADTLATGFIIERADSSGTFLQIANVNAASYADTGLIEGATYTYRVTAYDAGGTSAASATASTSTLQRPGQPANLSATAASISEIDLSWTPADTLATGFIIERADSSGTFSQIANVNTASYADTGLIEGATYTYRVTAYDAGGTSATSATATASTLQRPASATNLQATAASISQINLTWTAGDALATGFIVERADSNGVFAQVANVAGTSYADSGLSEGDTYTYRVTAYNAGGSAAASGTAVATTLQRPATPLNLTATPASSSEIDLNWSAGDGLATGFTLERAISGGSFAQIASVTGTSYADTGLAEGGAYIYRVSAYNAGGSSGVSSLASATTLHRPGTPTGLTGSAITTSQINLTWSPADALATVYLIERALGSGAYSPIANVTTNSYSDSGLTEGASYTYRVTAYNNIGSSAASITTTITTLQRPGTPTSVTATTASISAINVKWTAADAFATDYVVERSIDNVAFAQVADVTTTSFSDSGLLEGAVYVYRVTAHDSSGYSATSGTVQATTYRRPGTPTGLTAIPASTSQINVSWTAADANATGFTVERALGSGAYSQIATVTGTTYSDTGVTGGATYTYRITSYNAGGSLAGATVSTSTKAPGTPSSFAAAPATTSSITLSWKTPDTLATDYVIERSTDGGATFTQLADPTKTTYTDTGLTSGNAYTYRVTARNAIGSSTTTAVSTATVPYPPAPATGLQATPANANEIDLTWTAGDAITTSYLVERSANSGKTWTSIATPAATSYADTGLIGSTTYTYRVTATYLYGSSTPSATASAATLVAPPAPTSLTATTASTSEIDIAWNTSDSSVTSYFIQRATNFGAYVQVATINVVAGQIAPTTYADTGLAQNTIYQYQVSASNASGYGSSPVAQAVTQANPTPAPPTVRPSATNTGVQAGVVLTSVASFKPKSNTTYSNLSITGQITMTNLTNITFINCVIDANGASYGFRTDGASNITIQNCEIKNAASAAIYGDGFNAISNYIHDTASDGIKAGNNTFIYGNYVTDIGFLSPGAHADGVQIRGATHVVIVGNFFDTPINQINTDSNSALFLQLAARDVVFANNWIDGGNYPVHAVADGGGGPTILVLNNLFYAGTDRYTFGQLGAGVIWSGNVTDTGAVALPTGH